MAFVYFGDFSAINGAQPEQFGHLASAIAAASDPIMLSLGQVNGTALQQAPSSEYNFSVEACVNLFYTIDLLRRPVYLRVAAFPSTDRNSVVNGLADAKRQMDAIYSAMLAYGMADLLAGFVFDNLSQNVAFADGSYWTRDTINQLLAYAHDAYNVGACVLCNAPVDAISLFTPYGAASAGLTVNKTLLGDDDAYPDWLIHLSPLAPSTGWYAKTQPPNLSMFVETLRLLQTSTVNQAVLQHFPTAATFTFDDGAGMSLDPTQEAVMRNAAYFFAACGLTNFCFTAFDLRNMATPDATVNIAWPFAAYRPLFLLDATQATWPNANGVANVYLDSDGTYVYVRQIVSGATTLLGQFNGYLEQVVNNNGTLMVTDSTL